MRIEGKFFDRLSDELVLKDRLILYVIVFGLMATSGVPYFLGSNTFIVAFLGMCVAAAVYFRINVRNYIPLVLAFTLVLVLQIVFYGFSFYKGTAALHMMLLITGLTGAAVSGIYFIKLYNNLMIFFSVVSLLFFVPIYLHYPFHDLFVNNLPFSTTIYDDFTDTTSQSIFFLNFPRDFEVLTRNTGPFWEPGAFGGFLVLSFMLNTIKAKSMINKQNIVFGITILSTFSTTAYLSIFLFVGGYYFFTIKNIMQRVALVSILVFGFFVVYNTLDFLSPKITAEFDNLADDIDTYGGNGRYASGYLDIKEFAEDDFYYFAGRGVHPDTRYGGNFKNVIRTNGVTDQLVIWGIPFFLLYLYCIRKSFAAFCSLYVSEQGLSYVALIVLLILATSEVYFRTSFFWALFFIYVPVNEYVKKRKLSDDTY